MTKAFAILIISTTFSVSALAIIGGDEIRISEAPYQVGLEADGEFLCGGAIIDRKTILTTSLCSRSENLIVRAGSSITQEAGWISKVDKVIHHELFNNLSLDYDISILKLEPPLEFNSNIQPIRLVDKDFEIQTGMRVTATGWGITENDNEMSSILRKVELKIVDKNVCTTSQYIPITERMICAADTDKDTCNGDAGGPLVFNNTLIGLISFGIDCAHPLHPGIYVNVQECLPWIKSNMELEEQVEEDSGSGIGVGKLVLIVCLVVLILAILLVFLIRRSYRKIARQRGERLIME